jgi:hypothetical protein
MSDTREARSERSPLNPPLIALTLTTLLIAVSLVIAVLDGDSVSAADHPPSTSTCADHAGR